MRPVRAAFWTILILVYATGFSLAEMPIRGGQLVVCQPAEPPGLDPTANTAAAIDRVVYSNIYEGLVKIDDQGRFVPGLATAWKVSDQGRQYTFSLRNGVQFHDGQPFTAEVAAWNLKRAAAEVSVNPHPEYFRGIVSIQTPDASTLVVDLKAADALFIAHLAEGDAVMLPMGGEKTAKSNPVGTGPFRFVRWVRGDRVEMQRFADCWDPKRPYLDRVTFRFISDPSAQIAALKAGDVDVIGYIAAPEVAMELARNSRFKVLDGTTTGEVILSTNNRAKPFDDLRVRRAMAHAIDRQMVVDLAMFGYGTPIGSHWSPATPYYEDLTGRYPYDPDRARKLLAEAGYPDGFAATIKLPDRYAYSRRAGEVIADMLAKVGIRLKIEIIEWGQWISRVFKNKEYQLTVIGHVEPWDIGIYAKPDYYFQYDSKPFRKAYQAALTAPTVTAQSRWFQESQRIIADDAVNGYLFSAPSLPAMRRQVMGWWHNYPAPVLDCTAVWLQK